MISTTRTKCHTKCQSLTNDTNPMPEAPALASTVGRQLVQFVLLLLYCCIFI